MSNEVDYNGAVEMLNSGAYELVIYNGCYGGGPSLSEEGKQLLKIFRSNQPDTSLDFLRFKVVNELGVKTASSQYSQFAFELIGKGLKKYVDFNEYDGLESPSINLSRMIVDEVEKVMEAKGVLTKEEYAAIKSRDIRLTYVKLQL
jgi:hypothetical protein